AQDNLPAEDVAAVLHLERDQRHQKVDLKHHRICTREDVLLVGLTYAGFDGKRQNVCRKTNNERFCAFYKLLPESILDAKNYFDEYDDGITFERFLFTLNFLKLYDTEMVVSGCWGLHEDTLRDNIWKTLGTIQEHKKRLVNFDPDEFKRDEIHVMSVDCVNYLIEEPRIQPSTKWFDPKSKSAGFKYEYAMPLTLK
ncbi:hypothetical protein ACHAW6_000351, partial [Cyclotella cf. meneghiniana]